MKIAIISDIHDNFTNLKLVLNKISKLKIKQIISLGDYCCPLVVEMLANFKIPTKGIFGNNDGDLVSLTKISLKKKSNFKIANGVFDEFKIDNKVFFISHFPRISELAFKSNDFDVVCYGHDHKALIKTEKKTNKDNKTIINPGEISGSKTGKISFAIYDTKTNKAEILEVKN